MTEQVERELLVPARPEQVWEVITGSGWLADEVTLELLPGGEARFRCSGSAREGWVEEAVTPDGGPGRLVFWWAENDQPASRVELTLEPDGEEWTRLRVLETRPLEVLDLVGVPVPGSPDANRGPALLAAA